MAYIGFDVDRWTDGTTVDYTAWITKLRPSLVHRCGSSDERQPAFICRKKGEFPMLRKLVQLSRLC